NSDFLNTARNAQYETRKEVLNFELWFLAFRFNFLVAY
ncbi:unnamed protein product, partial [marine sediment metagenome]